MPQIHFLDVTNRDGVQTARTGLSKFGKIMVNFYLGRLGVAQSEIGFPFLFHEAPYVRACVALGDAGAFGRLRLSGWCRAVVGDVAAAADVVPDGPGLRHYNLSISTSDQMIAHKFRGKLDRASIITEMTAAVRAARAARRRDDRGQRRGRLADRRRVPARVRPRRERGGRHPRQVLRHDRRGDAGTDQGAVRQARLRRRPAGKTHCHNDLGMAVANSLSGALGDLDAGHDAWINTCVNGIGERAGNADLLSCILAVRHGFGLEDAATRIGDELDLSWARRFALWASYAFSQPAGLAWNRAERVRARVGHSRRRRPEGPRQLRALRRFGPRPVPA